MFMNFGQLRIFPRWGGILSAGLFLALWMGVAAAEDSAGTASAEGEGASSEASSREGEEDRRETYLLLPRGELFEPLVADVRWPRFSGEYQWRMSSDDFEHVAEFSFGESFSFVRSPQYDWGEWEIGMQAMVDALFDLSQESFDLSNEDYMVGLSGSVLTHGMTTQLRLYHVSSHLGDEYLIESGVSRDSVSFEVVDLLVSYVPVDWARVYGGVGFLVNRTPSYDRFTTQFGLELTSLRTLASGLITPIFATDLQLRQENDWIPEVSVLAGLRLARPDDHTRRIEFYARYYHGRSPDGQFFDQTIDSLGVGIQLGF
jgi:hypothetical protein